MATKQQHNEGVAIFGGNAMIEVGTGAQMKFFFDSLRYYTNKLDPDTNYSLVLDRLYKRYLKPKEFEVAEVLLAKIQYYLGEISVPAQYKQIEVKGKCLFYLRANSLANFFEKHFRALLKVMNLGIEEQYYHRNNLIFHEIMIVRSHPIAAHIDIVRPKKMYDDLTGDPYWLNEFMIKQPD